MIEPPAQRRSLMGRLVPRTIAAQLTLLLMAALLVSHAMVTGILVDDRQGRLEQAQGHMIVVRVLSIIELIDATPKDLHGDILRAASDIHVRFRLASEPSVAREAETRLERRLSRFVSNALGGFYEVRLLTPPRADREWRKKAEERWRERRERWAENGRPPRQGDGPPRWRPLPRGVDQEGGGRLISMSVDIGSERWLNVTARIPSSNPWAWPIFAPIGVMAGLIVLIVVLMVGRIVRPLKALATAADQLGRGETVDPLPERGPSEIVRTTKAFNAMEARLTRFIADRTRFLATIGHDLRTPITSLRLRAEFVDDDENREKIVETLNEMAAMIEATLAFAKDDAAKEPTQNVSLPDLLSSIAADFEDLGSNVVYEGPQALVYPCRTTALKRAVHNLVENAVRYGGDSVIVRLTASTEGPHIEIEDSGPGIDEARLADVFEPFVRLEASRNPETGGVGLGLSIARSIARAQGGDLTLENRKGPDGTTLGLTARISLPPAPWAPERVVVTCSRDNLSSD